LENIILDHGVSLLRWRSGGVEHPHDTPPYTFMPSPTFAHSSIGHREDDIVVVDALREIKPPFSPESVVGEFSALLKSYRVSKITGDRYAG
jgi:hypothetical protein